jgi:hypothetical protein
MIDKAIVDMNADELFQGWEYEQVTGDADTPNRHSVEMLSRLRAYDAAIAAKENVCYYATDEYRICDKCKDPECNARAVWAAMQSAKEA